MATAERRATGAARERFEGRSQHYEHRASQAAHSHRVSHVTPLTSSSSDTKRDQWYGGCGVSPPDVHSRDETTAWRAPLAATYLSHNGAR